MCCNSSRLRRGKVSCSPLASCLASLYRASFLSRLLFCFFPPPEQFPSAPPRCNAGPCLPRPEVGKGKAHRPTCSPVQKLPCSPVSFPAEAKPPPPAPAWPCPCAQLSPPSAPALGPHLPGRGSQPLLKGREKSLTELRVSFQSGSTQPEVFRAYFILFEGFSACAVRVFPIRGRRKVTPSISTPGVEPEDGACRSPALQCSETLWGEPGEEVPVQMDNK